jgi:SsrA-binding protein
MGHQFKILAENKRAQYDYRFLETFEAGLVLSGSEVKAIKNGRINLAGSYVVIKNGEAFLINAEVPPYQPKNAPLDYDLRRNRKLLLTKKEIKLLAGKISKTHLTLIPLKVYNKNNKLKLEFALAQGKKKFDKREIIKKRELKRKIEKALKSKEEF